MKLTNQDLRIATAYLARVIPSGYAEQDELRQLILKIQVLTETLPRNWKIDLPESH